mmetsp:Transcript_152112/g.488449  ORF Transcript_152112/g.488449 Transcript_152112/m.488449 type:complete len:252 (+) Transcript_152112:273-1028(+)
MVASWRGHEKTSRRRTRRRRRRRRRARLRKMNLMRTAIRRMRTRSHRRTTNSSRGADVFRRMPCLRTSTWRSKPGTRTHALARQFLAPPSCCALRPAEAASCGPLEILSLARLYRNSSRSRCCAAIAAKVLDRRACNASGPSEKPQGQQAAAARRSIGRSRRRARQRGAAPMAWSATRSSARRLVRLRPCSGTTACSAEPSSPPHRSRLNGPSISSARIGATHTSAWPSNSPLASSPPLASTTRELPPACF